VPRITLGLSRRALPWSIFLLSLPAQYCIADKGVQLSIDSESYSAIGPIRQLLDDLEGRPLAAGNFAFTHNQVELSYRSGNYELSSFSRYDFYLRFNRDTVDFAYQYKNNIPLDEQRLYQLYLDANHMRANGLGVAYYFANEEVFSGKIRLNYLAASELKDGVIQGYLRTHEDSYDADIGLDYAYSEDTLLERPPESVRGHGYGFDIDVNYRYTESVTFALVLRDLFTRLGWGDVTYTQARITSDNVSYDEQGRIQTRPVLSGVESYRDQRQRLPLRTQFDVSYAESPERALSASLFSYDGRVFPRIAVRQDHTGYSVEGNFDFRSKALSAALQFKGLDIMLKSDRLDWEKASHLALSMSYSYEF
jgi:hypothetical protein